MYLDAFSGSAYPEERPPQTLLPITAKQLPGYGGSMETAASDLAHYQKMEFASLVLCGNRRRAEILQQALRDKNLSAFLAFPLTGMPRLGQILLAEGSLPAGMEYPNQKLAILTEGQLAAAQPRKAKAKKNQDQPAKAQLLHGFKPWGSGCPRAVRHRSVSCHGADPGGWSCEGLCKNCLSGNGRAVRPGDSLGSGE